MAMDRTQYLIDQFFRDYNVYIEFFKIKYVKEFIGSGLCQRKHKLIPPHQSLTRQLPPQGEAFYVTSLVRRISTFFRKRNGYRILKQDRTLK